IFDAITDLWPRSAERRSRFLPGKAVRRTGEEEHIGFGETPLSVGPANLFHDDRGAAATIYAPHGVQEEDEKSPQRYELKAPLWKLVIAGRRPMAPRTDRGRAFARPYRYFDTLLVRGESGVMIDKSTEVMAAV